MASPKKFYFDVWLAQGKTVYRDVPYEVVTDWIQQGRLLGDDRIRPAKTEEWFLIDKVPAFAGFVPHDDPLRKADEKAEALEPVETGFAWGGGEEAEEADPDMIPLIDVSLVLLIFFMMTSTVASVISAIKVPEVKIVENIVNVKLIWIGINYRSKDLPADYTINVELEEGTKTSDKGLNQIDALKRIEDIMSRANDVPEIRVAAHQDIAFSLLKETMMKLEQYRESGKVRKLHVEVGEKK